VPLRPEFCCEFLRDFFLVVEGRFCRGFGNIGAQLWCFWGQFVVKCVFKDGKLTVTFRKRKLRHNFELCFAAL
jgi:hypothetical protein